MQLPGEKERCNPQFVGCEHKLLKRFCPASKCFMAELKKKHESPYLFEQV